MCDVGNGSFCADKGGAIVDGAGSMFEHEAAEHTDDDDTPTPTPPPDPWEPVLDITDDPANDGSQRR
jgi:hypothetical protein